MIYCIYTLTNPINNSIFYVGKTSNKLTIRMSGHLSDSTSNLEKINCIHNILQAGGKPVINIIEAGLDKKEANKREYFWIRYYKSKGAPLTNKVGMEDYGVTENELGNQILNWLFEHPLINRAALCKMAGIDRGNFHKYLKCGDIPEKFWIKLKVILMDYGF